MSAVCIKIVGLYYKCREMGQERIVWADSLKGILMLLVIIGHSIQVTMGDAGENTHVWRLIYSFHMPAFMAVSGWLMYRPDVVWGGKTIIRRAQQLLIPYLIWSILAFLKNGDYSLDVFLKIIVRPDKYYWFLWILFWINFLYHIASMTAQKLNLNFDVLLISLCAILSGIMMVLNPRTFGIQLLAYYFLFFSFGYFIHKFRFLQTDNTILLVALAAIWGFLGWFWTMHDIPSWIPLVPHVPSAVLQYFYRGITAGIAIYMILNGAHFCLNGQSCINKLMIQFGVVSLGLYVIHLFYLSFIVDAVNYLLPAVTPLVQIIIVGVLALIISYFTIQIMLRNKTAARLLLGKL